MLVRHALGSVCACPTPFQGAVPLHEAPLGPLLPRMLRRQSERSIRISVNSLMSRSIFIWKPGPHLAFRNCLKSQLIILNCCYRDSIFLPYLSKVEQFIYFSLPEGGRKSVTLWTRVPFAAAWPQLFDEVRRKVLCRWSGFSHFERSHILMYVCTSWSQAELRRHC